nr:hypothetical protein [Methylosinus sp. KRF6]
MRDWLGEWATEAERWKKMMRESHRDQPDLSYAGEIDEREKFRLFDERSRRVWKNVAAEQSERDCHSC